jgi:hypothetical protein
MQLNFSTVLSGFDGAPIKNGAEEVTLGSAAVIALTAPRDDDARLAGVEKFKRGELARAAWESWKNGTVVELTVEQVATIKEAIGLGWSTLVVWAAFRVIEGAA